MAAPTPQTHRTWVSPIATVAFIVLSVTGILMQFHIRFSGMNFLHKWIGVLFVAAGLLHLILNWKMLFSHFNKKVGVAAAAFALLVCIFLVAFHPADQRRGPGPDGGGSSNGGPPPQMQGH